jgi:hypothetical protein
MSMVPNNSGIFARFTLLKWDGNVERPVWTCELHVPPFPGTWPRVASVTSLCHCSRLAKSIVTLWSFPAKCNSYFNSFNDIQWRDSYFVVVRFKLTLRAVCFYFGGQRLLHEDVIPWIVGVVWMLVRSFTVICALQLLLFTLKLIANLSCAAQIEVYFLVMLCEIDENFSKFETHEKNCWSHYLTTHSASTT